MFAILAAVVAVVLVATFLLAPTPSLSDSSQKALDSITTPTNTNGRIIPEVFGTAEINGNIFWCGGLESQKIEKSL